MTSENANFEQMAQALEAQLVKLLKHLDSQTLMTREQQAWLLRQALLSSPWLLAILEDPEWQRGVREAAQPAPDLHQYERITPEVALRVRPGDVLNISYYMLPHKVVIETCNYDDATKTLAFRAIHYGRLGLTHPVTVMRENFEKPCNGSSMWLHKFPNSVSYTPTETLMRAVSRLGEMKHHPTANNAATLALWCRVRDHQRNIDNMDVPLCDDMGQALQRLLVTDHIDAIFLNHRFHAVLSNVESLGLGDHWQLLSVVVMAPDFARLCANGLRSFARSSHFCAPEDRLERVRIPFRVSELRQTAEKFIGTSLCWDCNEMQALAFLATGVAVEAEATIRVGINATEILPGSVVCIGDEVRYVLQVQRPERPGQLYRLDTVQYAINLIDVTERTGEMRLLVDMRRGNTLQLIRHSEADIQCPILTCWKLNDPPLASEQSVQRLADLHPGDPVCIRQDTAAYPLAARMPGLHAIVKGIELSDSSSDGASAVEVICYTGGVIPTVGIRRITANGHTFNRLVFEVTQERLASREEALQMAMARLGTGQYCCSWSNSRDLVRWCCVNHKTNCPTYHSPVCGIGDLIALPALGQSLLRLEQVDSQYCGSAIRYVCLTSADPMDDCVDLVRLTLTGVNWPVSRVRLVEANGVQASQVKRIRYPGTVNREFFSAAVTSLLNLCLVNASDRLLGDGVTDRDFCAWVRRLSRPGLSELAVLLAAEAGNGVTPLTLEPVQSLDTLDPWDHVVIERPGAMPQHLLVSSCNPESGALTGYSYGHGTKNHKPDTPQVMLAYFPLDKSLYPMQKVIQRPAVSGFDASSDLSSSFSAATHFPYDAAAWTQMVALELELNLLLPVGRLSGLLKSMLNFAQRVAVKEELRDDDSLPDCRRVLASAEFAGELRRAADAMPEAAGRRLYFLVRLIGAMLGVD